MESSARKLVGHSAMIAAFGLGNLMLWGCGDGNKPAPGDTKAPTVDTSSDSSYSIKFFVTDQDGKTSEHKAGPHLGVVEQDSAAPGQQPLGDEAKRLGSSQQKLSVCYSNTGGSSSESCQEVQSTDATSSADLLLKYAYESCQMRVKHSFPETPSVVSEIGFLPDYPYTTPWGIETLNQGGGYKENWFIFDHLGRSWAASGGKPSTLLANNLWPSCDYVLVGQEALLCTADRLAEIADAVDTTVWYRVGSFLTPNNPTVTVRIPPQATKDRFIARDLALNVLSNFSRLDQLSPAVDIHENPLPSQPIGWCSGAYAGVASGSITDSSTKARVFASPVAGTVPFAELAAQYLTETIDGGNGSLSDTQRAANRLAYKAQTVRAAARLTRDLVDKSLTADLAGAEWQRAHAADPMQGLRSMWGQDPASPDAYNSLEHALKMLYGRTETQRSTNPYVQGMVDPACGAHDSWDLVDALGPGFSARWADPAAATSTQSLAVSTVAKSGVVVPGTQLVAANAANLRVGIKDALMRQGALAQDADKVLTATELSTFQNTFAGQSITSVLDAKSIPDNDLLFGLKQAFDAYRLLTDSAVDISSITAKAGLDLVGSGVHANITALGGAIIKGGLPRTDLSGDVSALVGRAASASQCNLPLISALPSGDDVKPLYQSPFLLANSFGQRLDRLGKLQSTLSLDGSAEAASTATLAAAEVRSWASQAAVLHGWGNFGATPTSNANLQTFVISGLTPADFGAGSPELLRNKLSIVLGQPWMAECVAGRRSACPDDISASASLPGFFRADLSAANTTVSTQGLQDNAGPALTATFSVDPNTITGANKAWFIVAHGDAASGRNEGRVLATFALGSPKSSTIDVISAYRDQRANEIFGLSSTPQNSQTCSSVAPTGLPANYCIDGMQRDMFVPLANELTSNGGPQEDSWKHYLALAEDAAKQADDLGHQLIEAGKERDRKKLDEQVFDYNRDVALQERREAAQEKLADLCGAFVSQEDIVLDSQGSFTLKDPSKSPEVAACISAEKADLVFLGPDPYAVTLPGKACDLRGCKQNIEDGVLFGSDTSAPPPSSAADKQQMIRETFCKGRAAGTFSAQEQASLPAFCMNTGDITTAGLNLAQVPPAFSTDNCEVVSDINEYANGNFDKFNTLPGAKIAQVTSEPWANAAGIGAALGRIKYSHTADGAWGVTVYGTPIMGNQLWLTHSYPGVSAKTIYPVCETAGGCQCATDGVRSCTVRALKAIFGKSGATDEDVRLNVERALWHMGALAGQIPAGVFHVALPVANLKNDTDSAMSPAIYSNGALVKDPLSPANAPKYDIAQQDPDAPLSVRTWFGQATPMPTSFASLLMASSRKPWLKTLYGEANTALGTDPASYLSIEASNSYISFNDRFYTFNEATGSYAKLINRLPKAVGLDRSALGEWLKELARNVDGQTCSSTEGLLNALTLLSANVPPVALPNFPSWPFDLPEYEGRSTYFGRDVCGGQGASQADAARVFAEGGMQGQEIRIRAAGTTESALSKDNQLTSTLGETPFSASGGACPPDPVGYSTTCNGGTCTTTVTDDSKRDNCLGFGDRYYSRGPTQDPCDKDVGEITKGCLGRYDVSNVGGTQFDYHRFPAYQLRPDVCRPEQRVELFVDRTLTNDCDATMAVTQALGLSCLASKAPGKGLLLPPPKVTSLSELQQLEAWLAQARETLTRAGAAIYLLSLPKQSISDFQDDNLSASVVGKGNHGALMLALQSSLLGMNNAWTNLNLSLAQIQDSVALAKAKLQQNSLAYDAKLEQNDIQRLELNRQDAMRAVQGAGKVLNNIIGAVGGAATAVAGAYTENPVAVIGGLQAMSSSIASLAGNDPDDEIAAADAQFNGEIRSQLDKISSNAADTKGVEDLITLLGLSKDTKSEFKSANDALYQLRLQSLTALGTLNLLKQNRDNAKWQLGIISGSSFVEFKGQVTSQELNHVLARQYDGLQIRYERALDRAKRASYLARLAIEQRLGIRFSGISQPVGALHEAPSVWIDDICSLQGINYTALKTGFGAPLADGQEAPTVVDEITTQFADSFIGDYVDRLKELVEFYNIEHPFREADDVAVLSLKDDLLNGDVACSIQSNNELFHSDALYLGGTVSPDLSSRGGWRINRCDGTTCLNVESGEALNAANGNVAGTPNSILPPGGMGGISWFHFYTSATPPAPVAGEVAPPQTVYQSVDLLGSQEYVVTWWDMGRKADGKVASGTDAAQYAVKVYDSSWQLVGGDTLTTTGSGWSDRRELRFFTPSDETYHLAFELVSSTASLAIANVQLERASTSGALPSYYDSVVDRRLEHNSACNGAPDMSRFFSYECEGVGTAKACYWTLNKLIRLDTEALNQGVGPLVGKVGVGNYNHRLLSFAVNVVGSGVLDCSKDSRSSCYGAAYLEYDMDHSAVHVPIDDYAGTVRCFDFGDGTIRGGKALASERLLTTPLSSTDADLIHQPAFNKGEFFGRPLSGEYRLRIKDTPALQWANVEDLQFLLSYRYWARVGLSQ